MHSIKILFVSILWGMESRSDWVEIQQSNPFGATEITKSTDSTIHTKTGINIVMLKEQIENLLPPNVTHESPRQLTPNPNRVFTKANKSSIREVFAITTTEFTPLMSSLVPRNVPTTPSPRTYKPIPSTILTKSGQIEVPQPDEEAADDIEIEEEIDADVMDEIEDNGKIDTPPGNSFSSYTAFLPFLRSIQSNLMNKAHKSIKSKIGVLTDLRDNLLINIDERLRSLWAPTPSNEKMARGYKGESHMEFPSNEGALITIGFLTLAVFLVKLVLQVIQAIKHKKMHYYTTTTTTMATTGRRKREALPEENLDIDTTYRILSSIENFKYN